MVKENEEGWPRALGPTFQTSHVCCVGRGASRVHGRPSHRLGEELKESPCPVNHKTTHLCVPAGRTQGHGEGRVCPFFSKDGFIKNM